MEDSVPLRRSTRNSVVAKTEELTPRKKKGSTPVKVEPSTPSRRTRASSTTPKKSLFENISTPKKTLPVLSEEETPKKRKTSKVNLNNKDKEGSPKKSDQTKTTKIIVNATTVLTGKGMRENISTPKKGNREEELHRLVDISEEIDVVGDRPLTRAKRKTMALKPAIEIDAEPLEVEKSNQIKKEKQIDKSVSIIDDTNNFNSEKKSDMEQGVVSCLALVPKIIITDVLKHDIKKANKADTGKESDCDIIEMCDIFASKSPMKAEDVPLKSPQKGPTNSESISEVSFVSNRVEFTDVIEESHDNSKGVTRSPKKTPDYNSRKPAYSESPLDFVHVSSKSPISTNLGPITSPKIDKSSKDLINSKNVLFGKMLDRSPRKMEEVSTEVLEDAGKQVETENNIAISPFQIKDEIAKESLKCDPSITGTSIINDSELICAKATYSEGLSECKDKSSPSKQRLGNECLVKPKENDTCSDYVEVGIGSKEGSEKVFETSPVKINADPQCRTQLETVDIDNHSKIIGENSSAKLNDILILEKQNCIENESVCGIEVDKNVDVETKTFESAAEIISVNIVADKISPIKSVQSDFEVEKPKDKLDLIKIGNKITSPKPNILSFSMNLENEKANTNRIDTILPFVTEGLKNSESISGIKPITDENNLAKDDMTNIGNFNKVLVSEAVSTQCTDRISPSESCDVLSPDEQRPVENGGSNLTVIDAKTAVTVEDEADELIVSETFPIKIVTSDESSSKVEISDSVIRNETETKEKNLTEAIEKENIIKPEVLFSPSKETAVCKISCTQKFVKANVAAIGEIVTNVKSTEADLTRDSNSEKNVDPLSSAISLEIDIGNTFDANGEFIDTDISECECVKNNVFKVNMIERNVIKCKRCMQNTDALIKDTAEVNFDTGVIHSNVTLETEPTESSLVNKENAYQKCDWVGPKTLLQIETSKSIAKVTNVTTKIRSNSEVNKINFINSESITENFATIKGTSEETNSHESKNPSNNCIEVVEYINLKETKKKNEVENVAINSWESGDLEADSNIANEKITNSENIPTSPTETEKNTIKSDGLDTFLMSPKDFLKSDEESVMCDEKSDFYVPKADQNIFVPESFVLNELDIGTKPIEKTVISKSDAHFHCFKKDVSLQNGTQEGAHNEVMTVSNDNNIEISVQNVSIDLNSSKDCDSKEVNFTSIDDRGKFLIADSVNSTLEVTDAQNKFMICNGVSNCDIVLSDTNINDSKTTNIHESIPNISSKSKIEEIFQGKVEEGINSCMIFNESSFNSSYSIQEKNDTEVIDIVEVNASTGEVIEIKTDSGTAECNNSLAVISGNDKIHKDGNKTLFAEMNLKQQICSLPGGNSASSSKAKTNGTDIELQNKQCVLEICNLNCSQSKESKSDISVSFKDELATDKGSNETENADILHRKLKYKRIVSNDSTSDSDDSLKITGKKKKTCLKSSNISVNGRKRKSIKNSSSKTDDSKSSSDVKFRFLPENELDTEQKCYLTDNQISGKDFIDFEAEVGEEWSEDESHTSENVSSSTNSTSNPLDFIHSDAKENTKKRSLDNESSGSSDYLDSVHLLFNNPKYLLEKNKKQKLEKVSHSLTKNKSKTSNQKYKESCREVVNLQTGNENLKNTKTENILTKEFTKVGVFVISSISQHLKKPKLPRNTTSSKLSEKSFKKSDFSNVFIPKGFTVSSQIDDASLKGFVVTQIKSDVVTKKSTAQSGLVNQKENRKENLNVKNSKKSAEKTLKEKNTKKLSLLATFVLPSGSTSKSIKNALREEGITNILSINFAKPKVAVVEFSNEESHKKVLELYGKLTINNKPVYVLEGSSCS